MEHSESDNLNELSIIACLDNIKGLGPVKFRQIYEMFKSFSSFWNTITKTDEDLIVKEDIFRGSSDRKFLTQIKENC